jgi:serine/threonine-protein kinase
MLVGEPPFTAATPGGILARKMVDPIPSIRIVRPSVPIGVERAVNRALALMPGDRFTRAQEFAAALRGEPAAASDLPQKPAGAIQRQVARCLRWLEAALAKSG